MPQQQGLLPTLQLDDLRRKLFISQSLFTIHAVVSIGERVIGSAYKRTPALG